VKYPHNYLIFLTAVIILTLASAPPAYAVDYNDSATGNWNSSGTWTPAGIPGSADTVTIDSHTVTLTDARSVDDITISGGTLTLGSQTLTVDDGTWTFSSGTFNCNTSTVKFYQTNYRENFIYGSTTFNNVEVTGTGTGWRRLVLSDDIIVNNDFTINDGNTQSPMFRVRSVTDETHTITVKGDAVISNVAGTYFDTTTVMGGTTAQTIGCTSTGEFGKVQISNTSATVSLSDDLLINLGFLSATEVDLTIDTDATLDVTANNYLVQLAHSFTNNGTFTQRQGTVDFNQYRYSASTITGATTFYNLQISGSGASTDWIYVYVSDDLTVQNDFTLSCPYSTTADRILAHDAETHTIQVAGDFIMSAECDMEDDLTVQMNGTSTQTISNNGSGDIGTLKISNTSGNDVNLTSNLVINSSPVTIDASSTLDLAAYTITTTSSFTNNGTYKWDGDQTTDTPTLGSGCTVEYTDATGLAIQNWNYSSCNLAIGGAGTFTLPAALDVVDVTITAGTLDVTATNYQISCSGDWDNSATFNGRSGSVIFDGGDQAIDGSTTFYNFSKTDSNDNGTDLTYY